MSDYTNNLVVTFNKEKVLEYRRAHALSDKQIKDLEMLANKLNQGFHAGDVFIEHPSSQDKATFMANALVEALSQEQNARVALICAYLAKHYDELKQIQIEMKNQQQSIRLIFDQGYTEQVPLQFTPKDQLF